MSLRDKSKQDLIEYIEKMRDVVADLLDEADMLGGLLKLSDEEYRNSPDYTKAQSVQRIDQITHDGMSVICQLIDIHMDIARFTGEEPRGLSGMMIHNVDWASLAKKGPTP